MSYHNPEEEKPVVTHFTISDVSWDSFHLSWSTKDGAFQAFLIKVTDAETGSDVQNHTLPAAAQSLTISDLSATTWYRVNLYGLYRGALLAPVYADTITGINVTSYSHFGFLPSSFAQRSKFFFESLTDSNQYTLMKFSKKKNHQVSNRISFSRAASANIWQNEKLYLKKLVSVTIQKAEEKFDPS